MTRERAEWELELEAEAERLERKYSGKFAPDIVIRRLDWIMEQLAVGERSPS